jgi:hypothetical protein
MPLDGFDTNLQKACDVTVGVLRGGQFGAPAFACGGRASVGVSGVCDGDAREAPRGGQPLPDSFGGGEACVGRWLGRRGRRARA